MAVQLALGQYFCLNPLVTVKAVSGKGVVKANLVIMSPRSVADARFGLRLLSELFHRWLILPALSRELALEMAIVSTGLVLSLSVHIDPRIPTIRTFDNLRCCR